MYLLILKIGVISISGLIFLISILPTAKSYDEDTIKFVELLGTWRAKDANKIPCAIQFRLDGTFRIAQSVWMIGRMPDDKGQFLIDGSLLTLISDESQKGSCRALKGQYQLNLKNYGELRLKEQHDKCVDRIMWCQGNWTKLWIP